MPLLSVSLDSFLWTSIAALLPTIWLMRRRGSDAPYRRPLNVLAIVHTLFILYTMTVLYPPNLFQTLHLPLTMPSDTIRNLLLAKAGLEPDSVLPKQLESLLNRLTSFDFRTLYVRFYI